MSFELQDVAPGEPVTAAWANTLVRAVRRAVKVQRGRAARGSRRRYRRQPVAVDLAAVGVVRADHDPLGRRPGASSIEDIRLCHQRMDRSRHRRDRRTRFAGGQERRGRSPCLDLFQPGQRSLGSYSTTVQLTRIRYRASPPLQPLATKIRTLVRHSESALCRRVSLLLRRRRQ